MSPFTGSLQPHTSISTDASRMEAQTVIPKHRAIDDQRPKVLENASSRVALVTGGKDDQVICIAGLSCLTGLHVFNVQMKRSAAKRKSALFQAANLAVCMQEQSPVARVGLDQLLPVKFFVQAFDQWQTYHAVISGFVLSQGVFARVHVQRVEFIDIFWVKDFIHTMSISTARAERMRMKLQWTIITRPQSRIPKYETDAGIGESGLCIFTNLHRTLTTTDNSNPIRSGSVGQLLLDLVHVLG